MAIPLIDLVLSPLIIVPLLILITIEALVLIRVKWQEQRLPAFADAALANAVSFAATAALGPLLLRIGNDIAILIAAMTLAILIEGFVLMVRRRRSAAAGYMAALVTNVASFVFILVYALSLLPL